MRVGLFCIYIYQKKKKKREEDMDQGQKLAFFFGRKVHICHSKRLNYNFTLLVDPKFYFHLFVQVNHSLTMRLVHQIDNIYLCLWLRLINFLDAQESSFFIHHSSLLHSRSSTPSDIVRVISMFLILWSLDVSYAIFSHLLWISSHLLQIQSC